MRRWSRTTPSARRKAGSTACIHYFRQCPGAHVVYHTLTCLKSKCSQTKKSTSAELVSLMSSSHRIARIHCTIMIVPQPIIILLYCSFSLRCRSAEHLILHHPRAAARPPRAAACMVGLHHVVVLVVLVLMVGTAFTEPHELDISGLYECTQTTNGRTIVRCCPNVANVKRCRRTEMQLLPAYDTLAGKRLCEL